MRNISAHSHLVLWIVNQNFLLSRKRSICSEGGHYVKVGEVGTFLEMGHIYGHLLKQVETWSSSHTALGHGGHGPFPCSPETEGAHRALNATTVGLWQTSRGPSGERKAWYHHPQMEHVDLDQELSWCQPSTLTLTCSSRRFCNSPSAHTAWGWEQVAPSTQQRKLNLRLNFPLFR